MLIEFRLKNFMSFRHEVTLSMEKGNGDENLDNVFEVNDYKLLKNAIIYGSNASGKSNLLLGLKNAINIIRNSDKFLPNEPIDGIEPFMFDNVSRKKPCEFRFDFIKNKKRYIYYFSATKEKIIDESFEVYNSQKSTTIFSRKNTNEYKFLNNDKKILESIKERTADNKLFFTTATTWNYSETLDAFKWFLRDINVYRNLDEVFKRRLIDYKADKDLKNFTLNLLKKSDILINDLDVEYEYEHVNPDTKYNDGFFTFNFPKLKNINIRFFHNFTDGDKENSYDLDFSNESLGTQKLFILAPLLKDAFEENRVLVFDEFEKNLHPNLVEFIVRLFNDKKINKANSQIIFATHAVNLLDLDLVRRDQIWFTEKNPKDGTTDLYPLDAFNVRKDENIRKGYINGRYGAIPFIKGVDAWLEK